MAIANIQIAIHISSWEMWPNEWMISEGKGGVKKTKTLAIQTFTAV